MFDHFAPIGSQYSGELSIGNKKPFFSRRQHNAGLYIVAGDPAEVTETLHCDTTLMRIHSMEEVCNYFTYSPELPGPPIDFHYFD